jgi:hypothetical protein
MTNDPPLPWAIVALVAPLKTIDARLGLEPFKSIVPKAPDPSETVSPVTPRTPGAAIVFPETASFHAPLAIQAAAVLETHSACPA